MQPDPSSPPVTRVSPVPSPSQPARRLIRLSSLERLRLSSLNIIPDSGAEPPPKPPRSCSDLARESLKSSFVGWGVPVQAPQGRCSSYRCALLGGFGQDGR